MLNCFKDRTGQFQDRPLLPVLLVLCVTIGSEAIATEPTVSDNTNTLFFDQTSGNGTSVNFIASDGRKANLIFGKGNALTIRSKPDTTLAIVVQNENGVLFSYTAKDKKNTPVDSVFLRSLVVARAPRRLLTSQLVRPPWPAAPFRQARKWRASPLTAK
jgi:hypothetical protein